MQTSRIDTLDYTPAAFLSASALTMVLLVILGAAAVLQFGFLERRIHYR